MQGQPSDMRSRSPVPRRSRVRLTPGPHGHFEDDGDWGEWTHSGLRSHDDRRRPRSPSVPPGRHVASSTSRTDPPTRTVDLIQLHVRTSTPSLGSHHFVLRSGSRVEEIAILINDVLYYTLPCIAELVFPDPAKSKKSWETVYRSLMPHRHNIIQDEDREGSVSELPAMRLPHGNPGDWTAEVINEITREFNIPADKLPEQLVVQLGVFKKCWPYIQKTRRTYCRFQPTKKDSRNNHYGILFSFEPRRKLPYNLRSQSISPFFWGHNTDINSAIGILKDEELIRPSKLQMQPPPNDQYINWNEVWIPPNGFLLQREPRFPRSGCEVCRPARRSALSSSSLHWRSGAPAPTPLCNSAQWHICRHCCFPLL